MQIQTLQWFADKHQSDQIHPPSSTSELGSTSEICCIQQYFEQQVARTPNEIALITTDQTLNYRELNQRANQLAHHLRSIGIQPNDRVAISMKPAIEMIVAVLGILKAGGAYLPIDPAYPAERILYKLQDAQPKLILTQAEAAASLPSIGIPRLCLDLDWPTIASFPTDNPIPTTNPDALAYIIYTSGSTGRPKGVMVSQSSMVHHSHTIAEYFQLQASDRVLQFCSISFDIFIEEVFPTILSGGAIVLRTGDRATRMSQFLEFIEQQKISVLNLPTAFWHELANYLVERQQRISSNVRLVIVGGEKVSSSIYGAWRNLMGDFPRWLNAYGPTETTITATIFDPNQSDHLADYRELPIGKPIGNTKAYILDEQLQPIAIGEIGELYISGSGVAYGYLNQPDLTATKFLSNPYADSISHARFYKTGDLARYLPDGNIEFLGRCDDQVKIRGFRIELGEIVAVLEQFSIVQQAVVIVREDVPHQNHLVAYVILAPDHANSLPSNLIHQQIHNLSHQLQQKLPEYMRPSAIVALKTFPLTPNGKIDRHALPAPHSFQKNLINLQDQINPQNDYEFHLLQIWQKVLSIPNPGRQENFFALGGNSLLVAQLADQIEQRFGQSLSLTILFQTPTIAAQAELIQQQSSTVPEQILIPIQTGTKPGLFLCEGIFFYYPIVPYLGSDQPVYALSVPDRYAPQGQPKSLETMATECVQAIRAQQPEGPYLLGGGSFGGTVAYEVAQQLQAAGQTVALVVLFDTVLPHAYQPLTLPQWLWFQLQAIRKSPDLLKRKLLGRYQRLRHRQSSYQAASQPGLDRPTTATLDRFSRFQLNEQVERNYTPEPYSGKVVVFRANICDEVAKISPDMGWGDLVEDLEFYDVPGNHVTILQEPNVAVLGRQLQNCIQSLPIQID